MPGLHTVQLRCISADDAVVVAAEATRPGDDDHTVRQDGASVVITYVDKRFPYDVAGWAFDSGHASDQAAADMIARL